MQAFLFNALLSGWQHGQIFDSCLNLIVHGADRENALKAFQHGATRPRGPEEPAPALDKVLLTPLGESVLTESGALTPDWARMAEQLQESLQNSEVDDQSQGYWLDGNEWPRPDSIHLGLDSLPQTLPEDVRTALNWSEEKQFFFLVSALSPPPVPRYDDELEPHTEAAREAAVRQQAELELQGRMAAFPDLAPKELVTLVRARNSVIAAWLWRKQAAGTALEHNAIQVSPCCEMRGG